jgi:tRNA(Ile)-lysidine synthase
VNTKVRTAIEQYGMINKGESVTAALSGGADSVAMLHVLIELGYDISAVHVNHKLRGKESDSDEAFVRDLCAQFGVELTVHSIKIEQKKHQSIEEAAREARYSLFTGLTATAHTASDNAETVLLNMIRGTGLKGLCGIPPIRTSRSGRDNIIRPLILCERSEIEEYCEKNNLRYVTDSSNMSDEFTRNNLRLNLIPLIKQINPSFDGSITRMCEILREDSNFLEGQAVFVSDFSVKHLKTLEKPILTRIIMRLLSHNNISASNLRIMQIIGIIEAENGKINLEKHKFALIKDGILKIETINQNYR